MDGENKRIKEPRIDEKPKKKKEPNKKRRLTAEARNL